MIEVAIGQLSSARVEQAPFAAVAPYLPLAFFLLLAIALTVSDPRRIKCSVAWGLFLNYLAALVFLKVMAATSGLPSTQAWVLLGLLLVAVLSVTFLAALLIVEGVTLVRRESFSLAHSLSLLLGAALLAYLGAFVWAGIKTPQLFITVSLAGLPAMYLSFILVSYLLYSRAYAWWVARWGPAPQVVIVLGAGLDGAELTPLLRSRVDLGLRWYRRSVAAGLDPVLVTSGGMGPGESVPEGLAMERYALAEGATSVVAETRSRSTAQNLQLSRDLLGPQSGSEVWLAATSDYHAFRTAVLMRELSLRGNAVGAKTPGYFWSSAVLREYAALLREHLLTNSIFLFLSALPFLLWSAAVIFRF